MAAIVTERTITASPDRVWTALTQQEEMARWWADKAQVKPEVGSLGEFHFRPPAGDLQFEVAELVQARPSALGRDQRHLAT